MATLKRFVAGGVCFAVPLFLLLRERHFLQLEVGVAVAGQAPRSGLVQAGNLRLTVGAVIHRNTLPKRKFAPVPHTIFGKVKTTDGTHPSAIEARCPDGVFRAQFERVLFKNEAGTPGVAAQTVLKGGLGLPCKGKG